MMNEIGSEFWEVPIGGTPLPFPKETEYFLSGRAALTHIIEDARGERKINSITVPSYICETVIMPLTAAGLTIKTYPVVIENGKLVRRLPANVTTDAILLIDYFGFSFEDGIPNYDCLKIRDLTHSVFTEIAADADYCFGSLRKWAGFHTGGFAWKQNSCFTIPMTEEYDNNYVNLRRDAMDMKWEYISGKRSDKEFLKLFAAAEDALDSNGRGRADIEDLGKIATLDSDFIRERRRSNAKQLIEAFTQFVPFDNIKQFDCPLFVPILLPKDERNELRNHLISNSVYCPIHWPIPGSLNLSKSEREVYENELSIICDQRYDSADMEKIIRLAKEILN